MTKEEALKLALNALEPDAYLAEWYIEKHIIPTAVNAIKAALEAKDEPVAWRYLDSRGNYRYRGYVPDFDVEYAILKPEPLYFAQPQRTWVGLTDEDIDQGLLRSDYALQTAHAWRAGVVFAMTQLKEKNK
jgi:hypothetical protein